VDRTDPSEVWIAKSRGAWASFLITEGAARQLGGLTLDEEEVLTQQNKRLFARADSEGRRVRVAAEANAKRTRKAPRRNAARQVDRHEQRRLRDRETAMVKNAMVGRASPGPETSKIARPPTAAPTWAQLEAQERAKRLELIRQTARGKK
jgi:hypothetical protein